MPSIIVFPGQGSQFVGMAKSLVTMPKAQQLFALASDVFKTDLLKLCMDGPKSELDRTINSQPAVFVANMAAVEYLKATKPQAIEDCYATAGFSVGEYSALVLSGALTYEDALRVLKVRAEEMQRASELLPSGLMTTFVSRQSKLSLAMLAARKWCGEKLKLKAPVCQISNYLNAKCKVIGGNTEALDFIQLNQKEFGILKVKRLPVSGAFHTQLMKPAETPLRAVLSQVQVSKPLIRVHFNYDAKPHSNPEKIRLLLTKQLSNPVRWEQTLNELYYDNNLPIEETEATEETSQSSDRVYPDIYECGPAAHTGPILKTINHKAHRFYKFVGVHKSRMSEVVASIPDPGSSILVSPVKNVIITKSAKSLTEPATAVEPTKVVSPQKVLTEEEKIQQRIKKFGVQSDGVKLATRAERFGVDSTNAKETKSDPGKLSERAARFGIADEKAAKNKNASVKVAPEVSAEALEKRAARFGVVNSDPKSDDPLLNKRKERFGIVNEDDKKKQRSERFQPTKE